MSRMSELAEAVAPLDAKVAAAAAPIRGSGHPDPFTCLVRRFGSAHTTLGLDPASEIERVTTEAMAVA